MLQSRGVRLINTDGGFFQPSFDIPFQRVGLFAPDFDGLESAGQFILHLDRR